MPSITEKGEQVAEYILGLLRQVHPLLEDFGIVNTETMFASGRSRPETKL